MSRRGSEVRRERAQLVLVAAAVIAVALVPMALAYHQLGYHEDVSASSEPVTNGENVKRALDRAVHASATRHDGEYGWDERGAAVDAFEETFTGYVDEIESSRVERGVVYRITANETVAQRWAEKNCPAGPNREFGPCESFDGVVVQERAGESVVVAVGLDVRVTTDRGERWMTDVWRV
ncbi:hypothetical protein [Haloprofundus sp. MHR1]|uniref:DUF7261 family protein n=1 Tax=Haloprofundus sp. MHR1 TaxID=2572921 RepID=UPI0010BE77E7|nr:hypothetical protein [Haloprofundus sp. MHR1]QCJ47434.1 hypothetical protein FCF25_10030 [Haloprofundus sp. MHR1]